MSELRSLFARLDAFSDSRAAQNAVVRPVAAPAPLPAPPELAKAKAKVKVLRQRLKRHKRRARRSEDLATIKSEAVAARNLAAADAFNGLILFKEASKRGGRARCNWGTIVRIAMSPNVAAESLSAIAFGQEVCASSIRRVKVRVASALEVQWRVKLNQMLSAVHADVEANPVAPVAVLQLVGEVPLPVVVVGQVWKFDDTEVRWRTVSMTAMDDDSRDERFSCSLVGVL